MKILLAYLSKKEKQIFSKIFKEEKFVDSIITQEFDFIDQIENDISIIISDIHKKDEIKENIIPKVLAMPPDKRPYIFITCGPKQRKIAIETLGVLMGDYLLTPIDKYHVISKIKFAKEIQKSYTSIINNSSPIVSNSIYDPFLGILNQKTIFEVLIDEINRIKRQNNKLSIIVLKINQIEEIEKKYGKYEKLNTLRYVSQMIRVNIRLSDKIGAWHDDKFLLILPGCDHIHVDAVLKRISNVTYSLPINFFGYDIIHLNISANSAFYSEEKEMPAFLLVNEANQDLKLISID